MAGEVICKQKHVDAGVASCLPQALEEGKVGCQEGKEVAGGPFWTDKGFGSLMRGVRKDQSIVAPVARDMTLGEQLGWN